MALLNVINRFKASQILLLVLAEVITYSHGHINMTEYKRMPVLHKFDNYYECVNRTLDVKATKSYPAKYCMIFVQIQPDNNSQLWQQIEEFSYANRHRYRHDQLLRGLCLENCENFKENSTTNMVRGLLRNKHTEIFSQVHNTSLDHLIRQQYQSDIYECVNREFEENYNLTTETFIQYCIDPEYHQEKDIYFYITVLIIAILLFLCLFSSLYDAKLKSQQLNADKANNYYGIKHTEKIHRYWTAFSICRNYKRLVEINKSDIGIDFSFINGFRVILNVFIITEHTFLFMFDAIENPEFFETIHTELWAKLFIMSSVYVELFFMLTGLLLYVKFDKAQYITPKSTFRDCINVYVRLLLSRYLRLIPSLIFVVLFTANIVLYQEYGPHTRFYVDPMCWSCRENWWQNLLMINNYFLERACLVHTWYISADFQLYAFYLFVLIIVAKYPSSKTYILFGIAILAAAINVSLTYCLELDPFFTLHLEAFRFFFMKRIESAKHLYFSSYTNLNSFLVGIICGLIYMKYLRNNAENKLKLGNILRIAPYIGVPIIFTIMYLGTTIFYNKTTTIWTAMYCLLQRHVGLSLVAIIVLLRGMCTRGGFLNSALFRLLARISYQEYLWHILVFTYIIIFLDDYKHADYLLLVLAILVMYIVGNIISFVVALVVEYPFVEIVNIIDIEKNLKSLKTS